MADLLKSWHVSGCYTWKMSLVFIHMWKTTVELRSTWPVSWLNHLYWAPMNSAIHIGHQIRNAKPGRPGVVINVKCPLRLIVSNYPILWYWRQFPGVSMWIWVFMVCQIIAEIFMKKVPIANLPLSSTRVSSGGVAEHGSPLHRRW